ncbi:MAG: hypothetical protein KA003_16825 [Caldilineaceae bacterium]|nr:hypothetical protein [Caldilineaceae bacterium]
MTVPNQPDAPFSFSTWVKLTAAPAAPATLVALHANEGTDVPAWRFQLINSGGQVVPQLIGSLFSVSGGSCGVYGSFTVTPASVNLALNQWHQLGVNYDSRNGKNDVSIFLNGRLIHQERVGAPICRTGTTLRFGQSYRGQMDEFFFYNKALEVSEFLSQFVYQSTWYDVISTERFRVDYNAPTVKLTLGAAVKPGTNIFGVVASDTESGIRSVEYKDKDGVWKSANAESATTGVWAFGLDIQAGTTTVEVRATDKVGNVKTDAKSVVLDNTPPTVTLTTSGKQKSLTVQGTATDNNGSVQSASIMLIDPLGSPMNSPRSVAVVNGAWQYSQELPPVVNGTFQVWMSAVDQIGNEFKGVVGTVQVDNSPPTPGLIANRSAYTGVGANLPVIQGYVADQPYPEGMRLFIGFEDVPVGSTVGGTVPSTLDLSGNQWQALPLPGTSGPSVFLTDPYRQAQFQLGQTLVITNANPQLGAQRSLLLDPGNLTLMAWINPTSVQPGEQKILMQDDQAGFGLLLKGNQVTLRINRNGTPIDKDTGVRAVANVWQHLTVSFAQIGQAQQTGQTVTTWLAAWTQNPVGVNLTLSAAERINTSSSPLTVGAATNGYAGQMDDIIVYSRPFSELEARQLANSSPSNIQKVEVGFLHRKDKDDATKVVWRDATLDRTNVDGTTWQLQAPADLEGIYDISLRASDALGNQRILAGVWTGLIDTQAPRIVLGGTTPGLQSCAVTDFSLSTGTFLCGNVANATGAASALYATGVFTSAGLTWDAQWFKDLYRGRVVADRLYSLYQTGANFTSNTVAKSCDIYGNCTQCTVTANNVSAPVCTVSSGTGLLQAAGVDAVQDDLFDETALIGPGIFTATVRYERPDAYVPGTEPGAPTSEWIDIDEPYILIDNAVLASTRPFAGDFTEAQTEIEWGESISATEYYVGWTVTETAETTDLTYYDTPGVHTQSLADKGRYYAHVIAVDALGDANAFTFGPVYFDGATPASYLNWDEFGPGQPYWLWQDAQSATGQFCNVLGQDDRAALFSGGASARSGLQTLYGTWNDQWLALHWNGVNLETQGDLHLYIDSKAGGSLYAYDPYAPIAQAASLVVMPERRQFKTNAVDRLLADFAVIVEDGQSVRLMQWNGSSWQDASLGLKFSYADGEAIVWLSLAALGVNPNAVDVSLVGFVSEENSMQVWATMPGNNPLNSPEMLPSHQPAALDPSRTLLNLQTSMRLSADPSVNNTLDNCPTNVLFDQSILDVTFTTDPAAEIYDQVVYDGIRAVVPDDVESLLASLCAGVTDTSQSGVCQLAQQIADNAGGGGPEVGPFDMLPANAGPGDTLTFYATVRNLSNQETGNLTLDVVGDLPSNGTALAVGVLAPLESKVISFTETVDPGASYDFTVMTIYPVETVENDEESITLTYEHEPHTVINDIDRSTPISAALTSLLIDDLIGVGEQRLDGLVYDQSPLAKVTLQTSLGETVNCDDTLQLDAFSSDWACAINVPENTPDGTMVQVSLSAEDIYGFASGVIAQWILEVDALAPELTVFGEPGLAAAGVQASANTTETLLLEGLAGDERWLGGVQICDTLQGYETCQEAALSFFSDVAVKAATLADSAAWSLERTVDKGIVGMTVPFTVTAFDAAGNGTQQHLILLVDTLAPTVTLSAQPVTQIAFDGAFALSGNATDRAGVSMMELEVVDPLGEYSYYPIDLASPDAVNTGWQYALAPGTTEFAMPGEYTYVILAYDALENEREVGPFTLTVGEAAQPWVNAPVFVATSNDLWTGFAPGAPLYMRVQIDDNDLSLGDAITVTVDPLPAWLAMTRLDERTVEISGTVPLTITQVVVPADLDLSAQVFDENDTTDVITNVLQINVGMTLTDRTGKQAYQSWLYEQVLDSIPSRIFLPLIFK